MIFFCKKTVDSNYELLPEGELSNMVTALSSVIIIDSYDLFRTQDQISRIDRSTIKKSICILSSQVTNQQQQLIETTFEHIISLPTTKEIFNQNIASIIQNQSAQTQLLKCDRYGGGEEIPKSIKGYFAGNSQIMKNLRKEILLASESDFPVLLIGESGVGKTLAAKLIHKLSERAAFDFVPINMSNLSDTLCESTLFGTVAGAYTDAKTQNGLLHKADGGTFFMDEIGTTMPTVQSKLLTAIEDKKISPLGATTSRKIDFRIISSTNEDIKKLVAEKIFRFDFFCRISDIVIEIPPLRNHKEDIPNLCRDFIKNEKTVITKEAIQKLQTHEWPGNIRELQKCIRRAELVCKENVITPENIDFGLF